MGTNLSLSEHDYIPVELRELISFSERVFWLFLNLNGKIESFSKNLNRILKEPSSLKKRKFDEFFLSGSEPGKKLTISELTDKNELMSPFLVRLALTNRPCRLIATVAEGKIICWGEVIGDYQTTALNEMSSLAGKIQEYLNKIRLQNEEIQNDLAAAAWLQSQFLPQKAGFGELKAYWQFKPFEKIGGDFFNIIKLPSGSLAVWLIDVSGHGVPAAMMGVAVTQSVQRLALNAKSSCCFDEILRELEYEFPLERFNRYFTMVFMIYEPLTRHLKWINAGHPSFILHRQNCLPEMNFEAGPFIGMDQSELVPVGSLALQLGDRLFIYSDGVTERRRADNEFFGNSRLLETINILQKQPLNKSIDGLMTENDRFAGEEPAQDDLTILGIEISE
jgi:sigma-B regulation protein RsbU (phosphoserine phosphatase)